MKLFDRSRAREQEIHRLLQRSAPLAITMGRLVPAARSITPVFAGFSGVTPLQFLLYDLIACSIWALGLLLLVTGISSIQF